MQVYSDCISHSSPQLTLPEGTQPRWGHALTSCRMGESRVHATTFGGGSMFYEGIKASDIPKLADTTVLEFGEHNTFHCTIYWVVCSLTLSYCVNQFNRSLTDIHLGPTDCGSATCFLLCDIPAATDMQPPLLQLMCTDYVSGADWFSCCITSLASIPGHSHVQHWFRIVWRIEWYERISPIPLYTAISPWWHSMFVVAIARVMGFFGTLGSSSLTIYGRRTMTAQYVISSYKI